MGEALLIERVESVVRCTINRPPLNLFDPGIIDALRRGFRKLADDESVRVVVLTGSGRAFTAGMNVNVLRDLDGKQLKRVIVVPDKVVNLVV